MKKEYYFESGSSALIFALLKEKKKTQVVFLPEYICKSLVDRLNAIKIKINYYKIKKNLSTDWVDLKKKIKTFKNKQIYILYINYFGKINNRKKFIKIKSNCQNNNIVKLIEDNSHGHYLSYKNNKTNKIDILFSSPKKIFPQLYSGGILYKKRFSDETEYNDLENKKIKIFGLLKLLIKNYFIRFKFYFILRKFIKTNQGLNTEKIDQKIKKIDIYSFKKFKKINLKKELKIKLEKSEKINKKLNQFKHKKYFDFNENLPWYYVCFTQNLINKKKIQKFCETEKISFFNWPELPEKNKNKRTKYIYDRIICIPLK